jgi:low temperature requirement protein LtrA
MRQYFHKGLLWRAQEAQEVASYELFVDLFYVGIIAIAGDGAAEEATGQALLRFAITFILSWKFWSDISQMISWFDADDVMRRITTLFILTCLLGLTVNIAGSREQTYTPMIAFYLASRWFVALYYLWMAYLIPMVRAAMISTAISTFIPGLIWIGSIHVEEPNRQALIWIAIALDIFGPLFLITFMRSRYWLNEGFRCWSETTFDFLPGQNIEHKIERTNAFVTLVFGYSVVALLYQSAVPFGLNAFFGKAVLGLIQAFTFNWLYFEIDTFNMHTHAIRRHFFSCKPLFHPPIFFFFADPCSKRLSGSPPISPSFSPSLSPDPLSPSSS